MVIDGLSHDFLGLFQGFHPSVTANAMHDPFPLVKPPGPVPVHPRDHCFPATQARIAPA